MVRNDRRIKKEKGKHGSVGGEVNTLISGSITVIAVERQA
jgi:hypothetical protein